MSGEKSLATGGSVGNGKYIILKKLGESENSTTYKARDQTTNKILAIQVIKNHDPSTKDNCVFSQERIQKAMSFHHPNIVSVCDYGEDNSEKFLALEFVDSESLLERIKNYPENKFNTQQVLHIGMEISKALDYLHEKGFVHKSISPASILIDKQGNVRLSDLASEALETCLKATQDGRITKTGKVPFGVADVDNLLLGGIPDRQSLVLSSPSCEKRELLIREFLRQGVRNGEPTFYLTIDPRKMESLADLNQDSFRVFLCNPRADTISANFKNVTNLRGTENLTAINIALTSEFRKLSPNPSGARRACIEILSDVLLQHHAVVTRKWLVELLSELTSKGFTTLGVINPQMHSPEEVQAIIGLFDGEIAITEKETEQGPRETLKVKNVSTNELNKKEIESMAYSAPEMIFQEQVDSRTDLYSLGAVLFEMLTGKSPLNAQDPAKPILERIRGSIPPCNRLNPSIPPALTNCVMKLLEKNPQRRYSSAKDLLEDLREIAQKPENPESTPFYASQGLPEVTQTQVTKEVPLVDRLDEIRKIRDAIHGAISGKGGLILLSGEAGIGKTRLANEAGIYAQLRGMKILHGRYPTLFTKSGVPPYVIWREVIKDYLTTASSEKIQQVIGSYPAQVIRLVPQIEKKLASIPQSVPIIPEHEQYRFFEAVSQLLANISRDTPLIVLLEDLQWADQSSLLLLHYLVRGIQNEPFLIIGTYRDSEVSEKHVLSSITMELRREKLIENIVLRRLSPNETTEMLKLILAQNDLPDDFSHLIHEKSRGNPLFIQEIVNDLIETQKIHRDRNKWETKDIANLEFPQNVRSIIKSRIEKLDDESQKALQTASVIGERFTFEALHEISKISENTLFDLIEKILKTGLLKENVIHGEESYSFADAVVREVLHEEISHLRRKRLHITIASSLEHLYTKNIEDHYGDLAYHFLEGADYSKALDYFLKAKDKAEKTFAHDEAFSYLNQALDIIKSNPDFAEQEAIITEKMGDLKALSGAQTTFMEYWNKSLESRTKLNDKKGISRINSKMAHMLWENLGDKDQARKHHQVALEVLENEPESEELASLYEDISRMLWRSGKHSEAMPWAEKALTLALKLDIPEILAKSYANLGAISTLEAQYDKGIMYLEKAAKTSLENECAVSLRLLQNLTVAYGSKGDFPRGLETCQKAFELAKRAGDVNWIAWNGFQLAYYYMWEGEIQKSITLLQEVLALDKKTKNLTQIANAIALLGRCHSILGEHEEASRYLTEAYDLATKIDDYQIMGNIHWWLGELYFEMQDLKKAEEHLTESNAIFEKAQDLLAISDTAPALAKLYMRIGKVQKAEILIEQVCAHAAESESNLEQADSELYKGTLLKEQKKFDEAIEHFTNGLKLYESFDARRWYVHRYTELLNEFGLAYMERGETGDRERAYVLLDQTLEMYQKIGAREKAERLNAKKKQLISKS